MAYQVRRINWNLLIDPTSKGYETQAAAGSKLGSLIAGAGQDIGNAITNKRDFTERKREFDARNALAQQESARQDAELSLRQKAYASQQEEVQAASADILDKIRVSSERAATTQNPADVEEFKKNLEAYTTKTGMTPQQVQERLANEPSTPTAPPITGDSLDQMNGLNRANVGSALASPVSNPSLAWALRSSSWRAISPMTFSGWRMRPGMT